ncbi:hypothetical protein MHU86_13150 [Fragilaria crotonensis]|nr:hypothetical protein MHU86_13150 [Fragilaria crotonensis]
MSNTKRATASTTTNPTRKTILRFDWTNLPPQSEIGKRLQSSQSNCSLPVKYYVWRDTPTGMGSDLHAWSSHLWVALLTLHRMKAPANWIWTDPEACSRANNNNNNSITSSTLLCYFPAAESTTCPDDIDDVEKNEAVDEGDLIETHNCGKQDNSPYDVSEFRAGSMEFLFSSVSPLVIQEAERQIKAVFGDKGVPPNLITVHVRWGDKYLEDVPLIIEEYITAVEKIVKKKELDSVHILLCTEDPVAEEGFRQAAHSSWSIYLDHFYTEFLPFREEQGNAFNVVPLLAVELKGKPGLWALGSLLVAMEANYFVLTTTSNWSRLMDELRKNVIDPRCDGCTYMIDLQEGIC